MSVQTFLPFFCTWTGLPIHANQNNDTTTKNIVLCFLTVCFISYYKYVLYAEHII